MCILNKMCCISPRYVFAIMGFFATLIGFMIRLSVDLTLPYMLNQTISKNPVKFDQYSCPTLKLYINESKEFATEEFQKPGTFNWDEQTQQSVAGIYRSAYIMSQPIGGIIADVRGGKMILTITFLMSGVSTLVLPVAAKMFDSNAAVALRFIAGFTGGTLIPVLMSTMSKWVPHDKRSSIGAIIFPGALIGHVAASYISRPLIRLAGWEAVYYVFGIFSIIWSGIWLCCGYNTPIEHPNISESEKKYLIKTIPALGRTTRHDLDALPWKAFLRCAPLWACVIGYLGREWAFQALTTQVPQFLHEVLRVDVAFSDTLSYLPFVCMWMTALVFGILSDAIIARECCSIEFVRKYTTVIAAIGSAICIMLITYSGCNPVVALFWMFVGMMFLGAYYSGVMINMLDITPNYAGTVVGVVDNIAINTVRLLPTLNKLVITDALLSQWRISFWLVFVIIIVSLGIYVYYMKADQMWWDDVRSIGYPEDWKHGLLNTLALIGKNGEVVMMPRKDIKSNDDK